MNKREREIFSQGYMYALVVVRLTGQAQGLHRYEDLCRALGIADTPPDVVEAIQTEITRDLDAGGQRGPQMQRKANQ